MSERKLIERLEEYKYTHLVACDSERLEHCKENEKDCEGNDCFLCVWDKAIKIVKDLASEHNNGFCEWEIDGVYLHSPHKELFVSCLEEEPHRYKYCPICGKQIKTTKELYDTWKQNTMSRFERVE